MRLNSTLSATARPFQPQAASPSALVDNTPRDYPARNGLTRGSLPRALLLVRLQEGYPPTTITLLMRKGFPLIPLPPGSRFVGGMVAEEIEVTRVVVTLMRLSPLEGGEGKRMDSLVRSKSPNLGARRVILTMWPTPLGSGPVASLIIVNTMRIPTSCP